MCNNPHKPACCLACKITKIMLKYRYGRMAELVDALDSKSNGSNTVRVRFPLRPPQVTMCCFVMDLTLLQGFFKFYNDFTLSNHITEFS